MTLKEFQDLQEKANIDIKMPDTLKEMIQKNNIMPTLVMEWQKLVADQTYVVKAKEIDLSEKYRNFI